MEEKIFKYVTRKEYENKIEEIHSLLVRMRLQRRNDDELLLFYDELVDEYVRFCDDEED